MVDWLDSGIYKEGFPSAQTDDRQIYVCPVRRNVGAFISRFLKIKIFLSGRKFVWEVKFSFVGGKWEL